MTVILARLRADFAPPDEPPVVHAYSLSDDVESAHTLRAACGHELAPGSGERVDVFVGVPCTPCLLMVTATSGAVVTIQPEPIAVDAVGPAGSYAVGLRGERVCHLVPQRRITGALDGGSVVQTVCGCMAWGPLQHPPQWPVCDECEAMPDEAIS